MKVYAAFISDLKHNFRVYHTKRINAEEPAMGCRIIGIIILFFLSGEIIAQAATDSCRVNSKVVTANACAKNIYSKSCAISEKGKFEKSCVCNCVGSTCKSSTERWSPAGADKIAGKCVWKHYIKSMYYCDMDNQSIKLSDNDCKTKCAAEAVVHCQNK
ncbi:MAG: hypothetical protein WCO71_05105 [Pseudomonadota bacterium]